MLEEQLFFDKCAHSNAVKAPIFIDAFAGCGGLSLGLMQAGWKGLFAIEKDALAFETLSFNLIETDQESKYHWPDWLEKQPFCIDSLLDQHLPQLTLLKGKVDLLAGGPPCQGFSSAGRRKASDPRNSLMNSYFKLVDVIEPKVVLVENVHGITVDFKDELDDELLVNYADILLNALGEKYVVHWQMLNASEYGVPQARNRFFLIGVRKDLVKVVGSPFSMLESERNTFLRRKGLMQMISSSSAISDLEVSRNGRVPYSDDSRYEAICYKGPITSYQKLLRVGFEGAPTNTRLAKHRKDIVERFESIIKICHANGRLNVSLGRHMREMFGLKKQALRVLDPDRPSPTITSMPDDLLHYKEPRTLTVRENARLQSFPDWYDFKGKYTSGGERRKKEVPRFTQVANAVPPLLAEAVGGALLTWIAADLRVSEC